MAQTITPQLYIYIHTENSLLKYTEEGDKSSQYSYLVVYLVELGPQQLGLPVAERGQRSHSSRSPKISKWRCSMCEPWPNRTEPVPPWHLNFRQNQRFSGTFRAMISHDPPWSCLSGSRTKRKEYQWQTLLVQENRNIWKENLWNLTTWVDTSLDSFVGRFVGSPWVLFSSHLPVSKKIPAFLSRLIYLN